MKKKILPTIIVILLILLFPVKVNYKDGGTVCYRAVVYSVTDVHSINYLSSQYPTKSYIDGLVVKICGITVYDSTDGLWLG